MEHSQGTWEGAGRRRKLAEGARRSHHLNARWVRIQMRWGL